MKATESNLKDYLKILKIKENDFLKGLKIESLSTIAATLNYALNKPEKGDWKLIYFIKKQFPTFEIEYFSKNPVNKEPITIIPAEIDTNSPSEQLETTFKLVVGNKLKSLRKSRGFSAEELANSIGTTGVNYSAMENGRSHLNCYRMHLLSKVLNVSYQTIIGIDPETKDPKSLEFLVKQKDEKIIDLERELKVTKAKELKLQQAINEIQSKFKNL